MEDYDHTGGQQSVVVMPELTPAEVNTSTRIGQAESNAASCEAFTCFMTGTDCL